MNLYTYKVKEVISIYDGDTMKAIIDMGFGIFTKQTLRFKDIDAPEVRGDERESGLKSRNWLRDKIYSAIDNGDEIYIKTTKDKKGKYGRLIADVFLENEGRSLNEQMLNKGHAEKYI